MRIVLIGAGNLATNLAPALGSNHRVVQVWSRTEASAQALGHRLECPFTTELSQVVTDADIYIISVVDSALSDIARTLTEHISQDAIVAHTAGSMPMSVICHPNAGVFYPMQTFSRDKQVDFWDIPIFVEGHSPWANKVLMELAYDLSQSVYPLSSEDRRYLHVAAVFACNFANHCYDLSSRLLEAHGIPFSVMLPLIEETARKVHTLHPHDAQTGPAVRHDHNVMERHADMLADNPDMQALYRTMSQSIISAFASNDKPTNQ